MSKTKKIEIDDIPIVLEKIINIINKQVDLLSKKEELDNEDNKNIIGYATLLTNIGKDYRVQIVEIQKDIKTMSKEKIMSIVKAEAK